MKNLASTSFFRLFDRVVRPADPVDASPRWTLEGVDWARARHTYTGADYSFAVDLITGAKGGKKGWSLMVVREGWWSGRKPDPIKTRQWAHLNSGSRAEALAWLQARDAASRALLDAAADRGGP